jgi:HK97 gp10 family phage protein
MVKAAADIVSAKAKSIAPVGDPTHHPENKPLADTIGITVRDYGVRKLAVIGPQWPAGAHGHNVEFGHGIVPRGQSKSVGRGRISGAKKKGGLVVGRTRPKPFMRPAFDSTKGQQLGAMQKVLNQAIRDLGGT